MHKLRFRAWDGKIMHPPGGDQFDKGIDFAIDSDGTITIWTRLGPYEQKEDDENPLIPMRYIGHEDCDGTEIYEGDIVEWRRQDYQSTLGMWFPCIEKDERGTEHVSLFEVIWKDDSREGLGEWILKPIREEGSASHSVDGKEYYISQLKVVGNIYENPELRKEDH